MNRSPVARDLILTLAAIGLWLTPQPSLAESLVSPTLTGSPCIPDDVDWEHPVYTTSFETPEALADWKLEGGRNMHIADGNLVLESDTKSQRSETDANHLVCWLKREMPADFLLEFTVRPQDRHRGLNIVFFNARGLKGESVFDPSLEARDGLFRQYHSGDLNNYHISYWSGDRGTSNLRKNKGFHLVASGKDLVAPGPANDFQTIRIYKRGGTIRLTVDDILALEYHDDGKTFGPIHTHSGWIGLRQMGHTHSCEYSRLAVYPLQPTTSSPIAETPRPTLHQLTLTAPEPDGRRPVDVNPPTLRWPAFSQAPYTIELSRSADFADALRFTGINETFLRPLKPLEPGRYYWRVADAQGQTCSPPVHFDLDPNVTRWPIPAWSEALARVPTGRPRIMIRPEQLPRLRTLAKTECRSMLAKWERWAKNVIGKPLPKKPASQQQGDAHKKRTMSRVSSKNYANKLASPIQTLAMLYLLTEKPAYAEEIRRRTRVAVQLDPKGFTAHRVSDFANGALAKNLGWAYDALYDQWSPAEREQLRTAILERCRIGFAVYKPRKEQSLFGAHAWQHVIQDLTQGALAIYHESDEARAMFDWSFKMHVALYPWYGGADGGSAEGTNYYKGTNMMTSIQAAALFESATEVSLFGHPWFQNTPYFLIYTQGLGKALSQFADHGRGSAAGSREKLASMLWAHRLQDPYAAAYGDALETGTVGGLPDFLRLLWYPLDRPAPKPLSELPKGRLFRDVGMVAMHSDLTHPENDIYFEFRSSPYGSYNHAHADQNSFNVYAFGQKLIVDSGYYYSYGDKHHYGWTVRTRAHNTLLIGNQGQAWRNVDAYGQIVDYETGPGFVRTIGSCPNAYHDVAVETFDRHILWLEPDLYLISDDVRTAEPQPIQWLLHSAEKMTIADQTITLEVGQAVGRLRFIAPASLRFSQTDQFDPPLETWRPDKDKTGYPDQYHLTAEAPPTAQHRFITVLQVCKKGQEDQLPEVTVTQDAQGVTVQTTDGRQGRIDWR